MIRRVVFDLDGTLADTARLTDGRRDPALVLRLAVPGHRPHFDRPGVSDLPARLIEAGVRVGILTRSPESYATTVLGLLGVDFHRIRCSAGYAVEARAAALRDLARELGGGDGETMYISDIGEDRDVARLADCSFRLAPEGLDPDWLEALLRHARRRHDAGTGADSGRTYARIESTVARGHDVDDEQVESLERHRRDERVAPVAATALLRRPSQPHRRGLQLLTFQEHNAPNPACLLHWGVPRSANAEPTDCWIMPELLTRRELGTDDELRAAVLTAVGRALPARQTELGDVCALLPYQDPWRTVLRRGKDWRGEVSGPGPRASFLWFPALALAGAIVHALRTAPGTGAPAIVAVPATPYSEGQPIEYSRRLAHLVAEFSGMDVAEPLVKGRRNGILCVEEPPPQVILVDDQVTKGERILAARAALQAGGAQVRLAVAFTASGQLRPAGGTPTPCWWGSAADALSAAFLCPEHGIVARDGERGIKDWASTR